MPRDLWLFYSGMIKPAQVMSWVYRLSHRQWELEKRLQILGGVKIDHLFDP